MTDTPVKKGNTVFYRTRLRRADGSIIRARAETIHRDGTVTVTALFVVNPATGEDRAGYLGLTSRIHRYLLHSSVAAANADSGGQP